ncbi:MAG: hypothetical protein HKN34_00825, partial [Gammaproteobacteria bacterium]|nr:hypothetical protein [Gammaproteobacteria bacterium]
MSKKETNTDSDWQAMKQLGMQTTDYSTYLKLNTKRKKNLDVLNIKRRKKIKLALMSSANIDFFAEPMEFALDSLGIECEIYTAPFNT